MSRKVLFFTFVAVKKITVIFLLSIYLISATELHQLFKLPLLIEHFDEHKKKQHSMSLFAFLTMHYATDNDHDGDRDEDMKLPFKSNDECVGVNAFIFIPATLSNIFLKPVFTHESTFQIVNEDFIPSSFLSSIWQPPKF